MSWDSGAVLPVNTIACRVAYNELTFSRAENLTYAGPPDVAATNTSVPSVPPFD